jgi:hypothetical protein
MVKKISFLAIGWFVVLLGGIPCAHGETDALRAAVGSSGSSLIPALLDVVLLAGTFTCFLISVRVKSFLRDGELASGWTLLSVSFVLFFVAQLLSLFLNVGFLNVSPSIISSLRVVFILLLASGVYFMKKVLS